MACSITYGGHKKEMGHTRFCSDSVGTQHTYEVDARYCTDKSYLRRHTRFWNSQKIIFPLNKKICRFDIVSSIDLCKKVIFDNFVTYEGLHGQRRYVDRRDEFELMKCLQMFEYSGVDTKCPYIHQLYHWTGISIFIILMLCIVCEYLSWSGTILCCYLKQSATRNILKEICVSENSYPRRGIFSSGSPVYMPIVERTVLVQ